MKKPFLFLMLGISTQLVAQQKTILGFTPESAATEYKLEKTFDASLKADHMDQWMKILTAHPHHLGSPYGKTNAAFLRDLFSGWGFDARIETYKVLFPTPKTRLLEMTGTAKYVAKLSEPSLKEDATSGQTSEQLPVYNAWSADGDVTAKLVFVNYGVPDDYEELERLGIDVKGKIVIAKYGGSWRGIKPKVAQEHGAMACLIYSDPKEDGYYQGEVYPKGPFKNQFGAQRGSVLDMPVYPGDPLTPGTGATAEVSRLDRKDAITLVKIPVLPISYSDALPFLVNLGGPVAPERWRGALPITYHIGPGTASVHLKLQFDWKMVDCLDVIATMRGSELPDEWVLRGNHHDAWVNGASDPISGLVAELEEARAVSELVKSGWKPKRSLIYCAWDGEEPGLIGSTEWAEHHASELQKKAVVYINSDGNGRGFLSVGGSGSMETMVDQISHDVMDPETGVSVFERAKSVKAKNAGGFKAKKAILDNQSINIEALGSGSDYSAFIHHLGIPSLDMGYGGENPGGEYHSIYDSYDHFRRFKDPSFAYGIVLAQTAGRATLRFANAEVLPFDFQAFQKKLAGYTTEVIALLDNLHETTEVENQMIREKRYVLASDPTRKYVPAMELGVVPYLDFSSLQNAVAELEQVTAVYFSLLQSNPKLATQNKILDQCLFQTEQKLLSGGGLPGRPWYQHTICAPGYYTGYAVKTFPGVREAIEQRKWDEAQRQIQILARAISAYAQEITTATRIASGEGKH